MPLLFPRLARPDARVALRVGDETLRYDELARAAGGHAAWLRARGVSPGERVGVWAEGDLPTLVALVGNALAGVASVPLNPKLGERELAHVLDDSTPALVLATDPAALPPRLSGALPIMRREDAPIVRREDAPPPREVDDAPLLVLYTSGTTGAPKGAVLSARSVAANLDALAEAWRWGADDELVHALPLFHVHGLVLGVFGTLRVGAGLTHVPRFEPPRFADALRQATMCFAVPTMYHRLADAAEESSEVREALRRPRLLVSGSAALPEREHRRLEALTGRGVHERYGLTETLILCGVRADEGPRPGEVGAPLAGVELQLVDETGAVVDEPDQIGEVWARGPSVFSGYLGRPEATAAAFAADGWFRTGDLATRSRDGRVRIVGRKSTDLIKSGGFKIGAGEIESVLLEHPGVAEVAVLGVPDEDLGERIVAFVVPRGAPPAPDALIDLVAKALAAHKRPREIHFIDALPRNAMGKVQKAKLRPQG